MMTTIIHDTGAKVAATKPENRTLKWVIFLLLAPLGIPILIFIGACGVVAAFKEWQWKRSPCDHEWEEAFRDEHTGVIGEICEKCGKAR